MSVTIRKRPKLPGQTLNHIVYVVSTSLPDDNIRIRCFLYMEEAHYSDTWQPVGTLEQPCVDQQATIHLEEYLKEYLQYDVPDPQGAQVQVAGRVCRRFRVEFFEYLPSDQELVGEYYQATGASQWHPIDELEAGTDYLVVMDAFSADVAIKNPAIITPSALPDNYLISDNGHIGSTVFHQVLSPAFSGFTEISIPHGIKIQVYKWIKRDHQEDIRVPYASLGGVSMELLHLPGLTWQEDVTEREHSFEYSPEYS